LVSALDPEVRQITPELGRHKNATNRKARTILNWTPRPKEDAVVATAESLLRLGLLKSSADGV
jgi:dihydroflavonol-4-reductase